MSDVEYPGRMFTERLTDTVPYGKYCLIGKKIIKDPGPASEQMAQHVLECAQCSTALEGETPLIPN